MTSHSPAVAPTAKRSSLRRLLFAATLFLVATAPALASEWVARHGLTPAQYQSAFEEFTGKGFRLVSVSGYDGGRGQARYAAVWKKQAGPAWAARHGMSAEQYQAAFNSFNQQGYRLTYVNGYAVGNSAQYAAIWTKTGGPAMAARLTSMAWDSRLDP